MAQREDYSMDAKAATVEGGVMIISDEQFFYKLGYLVRRLEMSSCNLSRHVAKLKDKLDAEAVKGDEEIIRSFILELSQLMDDYTHGRSLILDAENKSERN